MTAVQPITISREEDGTYIVVEYGQSPQKLTKRWQDVQSLFAAKFGLPADLAQQDRNEKVEQEQSNARLAKPANPPADDHDTTAVAKGKKAA